MTDGMVRGGTEDKESCEDKALETVTTVVNKHLSHVTPHKQVANTTPTCINALLSPSPITFIQIKNTRNEQ